MISVAEATRAILDLIGPVATETVPLTAAAGRVLAETVTATRDQPPFPASAMDGYAVRSADAAPGARLRVIGTAPAGRAFAGRVGPGEAVRLFTGAPVPEGADAVVIQEETRAEGDGVLLSTGAAPGENVRPAGTDFATGTPFRAPARLRPADIALLAAMNRPTLRVRHRPRVAIIPTGDELVEPGETPAADQIVASTHLGLAALLAARGAEPRALPIARDTEASVRAALAAAAGADLIVTLGGASVGDHDLIARVLGAGALRFHKVAMRPGKPLMAGHAGDIPMIGLPGNPVSAMVCALLFVLPALDALLGLPAGPPPRSLATLATPLPPGGPREHYMRATLAPGRPLPLATPFASQDSARLGLLAAADALVIQPPHAPAADPGTLVEIIPLHGYA